MILIHSFDQLCQIRQSLTGVVLMGGAFDLLHIGHLEHIKTAKSYGNNLIVHVTGDARVREKKGLTRPINVEEHRAALVAAIRYVDYVFISDLPHYHESIVMALRPDVLFFNQDAVTPEVEVAMERVESITNIHVSDAPILISSSDIIGRVTTGTSGYTESDKS